MKRLKRNVDLTILELDVTKLDSIKSVVEFIIQEEGRIDILINNAAPALIKLQNKQPMKK